MRPVSASSTEFVHISVWAKENGLPENPTLGTTVKMAFALDKADALAWRDAEWEIYALTDPDEYKARCLVGPAGEQTLVAGERYWVKVQISGAGAAPEAPEIWANLRLEVEP